MRCKCCDAENSYYWKGDYYCGPCRQSIVDTIKEDRMRDWDSGLFNPGSKPEEKKDGSKKL